MDLSNIYNNIYHMKLRIDAVATAVAALTQTVTSMGSSDVSRGSVGNTFERSDAAVSQADNSLMNSIIDIENDTVAKINRLREELKGEIQVCKDLSPPQAPSTDIDTAEVVRDYFKSDEFKAMMMELIPIPELQPVVNVPQLTRKDIEETIEAFKTGEELKDIISGMLPKSAMIEEEIGTIVEQCVEKAMCKLSENFVKVSPALVKLGTPPSSPLPEIPKVHEESTLEPVPTPEPPVPVPTEHVETPEEQEQDIDDSASMTSDTSMTSSVVEKKRGRKKGTGKGSRNVITVE